MSDIWVNKYTIEHSADAGVTYTTVPGAFDYQGPDQKSRTKEVLDYDTQTIKRKSLKLFDAGTATFKINFDPLNAVHLALDTLKTAGTELLWRITYVDVTGSPKETFHGAITGVTPEVYSREGTPVKTVEISVVDAVSGPAV